MGEIIYFFISDFYRYIAKMDEVDRDARTKERDEVDRDARTKEMDEQHGKETVNRECATVQSDGKEYFMRPTH